MLTHGLLRRKRLLTERQEALLEELRAVLQRLHQTLERFGSDVITADWQALKDTISHLDELFLLVIVGEFNSGKSSFINALLGESIQPEGVTPTTDRITLLRHGDERDEIVHEQYVMERTHPAEVLRQLTIVDTPGTNAVIRRHEELTKGFIPRSDLVLFTTSADRPFTESERAFLELIREWGKKIVIVLNKVDILETEAEVAQVVEFVAQNARELLGTAPDIFPVSARMAIRSRKAENESVHDELWHASNFDTVERYVVDTLDEETRIRLKLLSPLGVAERLTHTYLAAVEQRLGVLQDDFSTLDNIEQQLTVFRDDLTNDVQYHLTEIDSILRDLEDRGVRFFDDNLRMARIPQLMQGDKLRMAFEKEVVGDLEHQIDRRIQMLVDWSIDKNLRLWQNITDYIGKRRVPQHGESIIGQVGGAFDYNRAALIDSVGQVANRIVTTYDRERESQELVESVHSSLAATAIAEVGALGLGAVLVALLTTTALDITGVLFATVVAAGGFFILPAKRRQAKQQLREKVTEMREQIRSSVLRQFERETDESLTRIREAISPYTRFVRSKREQLATLQRDLSDLDVDLERLRAEVEG
ncbi:MAG: dynamin [Chloroflexaceae bacterium]|nr:dynamin [Chloroflexaceae bacterium]